MRAPTYVNTKPSFAHLHIPTHPHAQHPHVHPISFLSFLHLSVSPFSLPLHLFFCLSLSPNPFSRPLKNIRHPSYILTRFTRTHTTSAPMSPTRENTTATANPSNVQDLERSKLLHGSTWYEKQHQDSFISKLTGKNRKYLPEVVNQYMVNWKSNPSPGQEADKDVVQNGTAITNLYFELSTDFYEVCVRIF